MPQETNFIFSVLVERFVNMQRNKVDHTSTGFSYNQAFRRKNLQTKQKYLSNTNSPR